MPSLGFPRNKWPKRHEFLVEQCQTLHVSQVLPYLHRLNLKLIDTYLTLSTHPCLRVVPRPGGPFKKWYFRCPRCQRPYETLYIPPAGRPHDWRCRVCWGLVYASQRYGFRHRPTWSGPRSSRPVPRSSLYNLTSPIGSDPTWS